MEYQVDRKPEGAQNADRDVRPTDAEAKESKNASSCQKSSSIAPLETFESHSIDTDENFRSAGLGCSFTVYVYRTALFIREPLVYSTTPLFNLASYHVSSYNLRCGIVIWGRPILNNHLKGI